MMPFAWDTEPAAPKQRTRAPRAERAAMCDTEAYATLPWHLREGSTYHIITPGRIDALTYVRMILRQQRTAYVLIASWALSMASAKEIASWLERGIIERADVYVEISAGYETAIETLREAVEPHGGCVATCMGHAKAAVCIGDRFDALLIGSGNFNANPRAEQQTIIVDADAARQVKGAYDRIRTMSGRPRGWEPWT